MGKTRKRTHCYRLTAEVVYRAIIDVYLERTQGIPVDGDASWIHNSDTIRKKEVTHE